MAFTLATLQELDALGDDRVSDHDHVLGHVDDERKEATLGVEPGVCAEFLVVRLQALYYTGYSKLIVTLGTV